MTRRALQLDGRRLTLRDVLGVARGSARVELSREARSRMRASRSWVERAVRRQQVVYGVTTGFGAFQNVSILPSRLRELQRNLVLSHCAGVGEPLPEDVVRAMMLLRANALARGASGIRVSVVESLLAMLNRRVHPVVPSRGSVGASGDLAPLSHMAAVLIGAGEALYRGNRIPGARALSAAGIEPVVLEAKEGLALTNGTQAMAAIGVLSLADAERIAGWADVAAAMTLEAVKGKSAPFAARVHAVRPHPGQGASARAIRAMIRGSALVNAEDADTAGKVQDSYSLRCTPQVHGASRDAFDHVRRVLTREINSATDNPLIFPDAREAFSAGNFHGQPLALSLDFLGLAAAELGSISERRTAKLVDRVHSYGLPPFLARDGGLESGLMIAQYTAAALASENKVLTHPSSSDSIPTSANQEDHVSMGMNAALHAARVVENVRRIIAVELLCAAQALEFRRERPGRGTRRAHIRIRTVVRELSGDRPPAPDIMALAELVRSRDAGPLFTA